MTVVRRGWQRGKADEVPSGRGCRLPAIFPLHHGRLPNTGRTHADLALPAPPDRLRATLLDWSETADVLDSRHLISHLQLSGLAAEVAQALSAVPVPLPACAAPDAMPAEAEAGWWHIFGLMHRGRLEEEVAAASQAFAERGDQAAQRRLIALCAARDALRRGEQGEADA
jgi:DNA primase